MEPTRTQRFARQHRLLNAPAFNRVFRNAERTRDRYFTVLFGDSDLDTARLGLAISKKNCNKAATRNRIKRIIRESFRQNRSRLGSVDIVVMNAPAAARASNRQLFESLEGHWDRGAALADDRNEGHG